ncbi:MAG: gamma carbonic anhydrase family protein [Flavobacteriaceae bacterium]|nr:gamma carbonic anhydrase family protein [Flavobacteriaceae bacterium]|tara:strand:+ start:65 stop:574 length:510 start_codon:yes stop_codon:yes gene_type:complete
MLLKKINGFVPKYGKNCFFAENSTIIGDVILGNNCSVWFQTVIRGDVNSIRIGDRVNIQDGAIIHCTYKRACTKIGNDVSIGHNAIVHGCTLEDNVLIGMGSIIMDDCIIGSNSIIASGCVLPKGTKVQSGTVYAGVPGKKIKSIDSRLQKQEIERIARNYITYSSWFK